MLKNYIKLVFCCQLILKEFCYKFEKRKVEVVKLKQGCDYTAFWWKNGGIKQIITPPKHDASAGFAVYGLFISFFVIRCRNFAFLLALVGSSYINKVSSRNRD